VLQLQGGLRPDAHIAARHQLPGAGLEALLQPEHARRGTRLQPQAAADRGELNVGGHGLAGGWAPLQGKAAAGRVTVATVARRRLRMLTSAGCDPP
jgi:hypothetical protein